MFSERLTIAMSDQEKDVWRGIHRRPVRRTRRVLTLVAVLLAGVAAVNTAVAPDEKTPAVVVTATIVPLEGVPIPLRVEQTSRSKQAGSTATSRRTRIERAISFALAQRGDRYRFGAAGPARWDCSGLVMKSFAKAGVKLPHQTRAILKKGKRVSKSGLQRGDIIYPQRGHVGIYLGGGKMVHASSGKGRVVVAKVYGFYTARRVL